MTTKRLLLPSLLILPMLLFLVACSSSKSSPTPTASTAASSTTPAAIAPTTQASSGTQVIVFVPPPPGTPVDGSCFSPSIPVSRPGAWRCMVGNQIHDPCFGDTNAQVVVCVANPTKPDMAVTIHLTSPLTSVTPFPAAQPPRTWAMALSDGTICTLLQGATGAINGERLNYGCTDGTDIIGDPKPGDTWTAMRVTLPGGSLPPQGTTVPTTEVSLKTVWQ